ncbi:ABC transporter substrate-binding protein [Cohnella sp. CFH 77786]|uniref:ABC transporter substrate-binding protein n=1 Tax=Cohnella sp. CFH 77786 TaxID=2662265 RepID=UPI001C60F6B7|nr:ABC transporter substrate-binding protein [Cohnella sp. CFH 77786]MBW5448671.1 ABC transporter substrate-binding protein [Cohnella sp. CFH 77786]
MLKALRWGKRKKLVLIAWLAVLALTVAACGNKSEGGSQEAASAAVPTLEELVAPAQQEGQVVSVGMPDTWANWKDTWDQLNTKYQIKHTDTDMSSAEEIAKFEAEKNKPTADIGDVGIAFGPLAVQKGVTQPYKTQYWDEVPDWAKDKDGHWMVAYTGSISFFCNKDLVQECPKSWADLENAAGKYKVSVGDVTKASQAQHAVLAAALAHGGDEGNIQPGIDYFKKLAEKDIIGKVDVSPANIQKGEIAVALLWDFNALGYRDQFGKDKYEVNIPSDGSVISGYATIINKWAPHPNAAKLARAYIFSDEGQINLAKGYARPIRSSVKLPADVEAKLIPQDQYKNTKPIKDFKVWEDTVKGLGAKWQEEVQVAIK